MPEEQKKILTKPINLSSYTKALVEALKSINVKPKPDEFSKLSVSQTVSFFAIFYEKVRNAVEYREDHLIRRAAIERILKRRFMLNPQGKGEAENLIREIMWARYFDNESLGTEDIKNIQNIINKYVLIKKKIINGRTSNTQQFLSQFIYDLMTCEIEEALSPDTALKYNSFLFFIYQVLRRKIKIEGLTENQKDAFFLVALEKTYRRSDQSYQRYHLFITFYKSISKYSYDELEEISTQLPEIFTNVDKMIASPYVNKIVKFSKKQLPAFLILFSIFDKKKKELINILTDKSKLWNEVDSVCREKYQGLKSRLKTLAIRSFIYIFLTKMLFALILEYPVSKYIYGYVDTQSIVINSLFPPILMLISISLFKIPGEQNTKRIYHRIIHIIDADKSFEEKIAFMPKKQKEKRPILVFGFTIFYLLTFIITFALIIEGLSLLNFNIISTCIFVFFLSLVTFFSYRIKQTLNEYRQFEKEGVFEPILDFFFMPILSLGKFFSRGLARLNFFIFIFDFIIEAPFKFIFEIVEEWISFVKKRKEEIE